jgi:5-methylthioadenosine/S-adenosylhomocysteine deaminase
MNPRTILSNGKILSDPDSGEIRSHAHTACSDNRLEHVNQPEYESRPGDTVIDCTGCIIMPGLINAHNHCAMSLFRGIADDLPLDAWLNNYIFPVESRFVSPEFVYLGTKLSAAEMVLSGTTTVADAYFFMEQSSRALIDVGMRGVAAQGVLDLPAPDCPEAGKWRQRLQSFLAGHPADDLVRPAVFVHSAYLAGADTFRHVFEVCRKNGLKMFCHVAETVWEIEEIARRYGRSPVQFLDNIGCLNQDFIAVHCVHLTPEDISILTRNEVRAAHCPESNMKLASGASPVNDLLNAGVTTALGTDGPASNNNLDMWEEMRTASFLAKVRSGDPQALNAHDVIKMATTGGARALGLDDEVGKLVPGMKADVIVIDMNQPHLTPTYNYVSNLVYSARGSDVRDVIINGKVVVRDHKLVSADLNRILMEAHAFANEVSEFLERPRDLRPG